jgi:hypothetical protein
MKKLSFRKLVIFFLIIVFNNCSSNKSKRENNEQSFKELSQNFKTPSIEYHPETWFHLNGNNISKEGLTLDLEAIKKAGLQGIHLFNKAGQQYPNVKPVKILSPEWEDMIRHAADECKRLGLKFTMQNCPGWSMAGGPWVPVKEAQREIVETSYHINGNKNFNELLKIDSLYNTPDYDYKDIQVLAFPTVLNDDLIALNPIKIESNNSLVPWKAIFNPNSKIIVTAKSTQLDIPLNDYRLKGISKINNQDAWVKTTFDSEITLRSIIIPPLRHIILDSQYPKVDVSIRVETINNTIRKEITIIKLPSSNWDDRRKQVTLAIPETTGKEFIFTFLGKHSICPEFIKLSSQPKLHNFEAKAGKVLRSLEKEVSQKFDEKTIINSKEIINLSDKMTPEGKLIWNVPKGNWTIVRFGHVNMRLTNKPAVPEATGWEASKLDKIAIENHLKNGMIGNLLKNNGPISNGKLHGLLIDSWESHVPTWTINSEDVLNEFIQRRGYSMKPYLPATMGYVIDSEEITTKFLRDLRHTMDEMFIDNFFKHFAKIAHDMGAEVYTEGAGGEVLPIDPMRYYGVSDIPMTEFWYPSAPTAQNEYEKPIYNAASATHLYNKKKLAAEACTQVGVAWNEHPFSVKSLIDYNFTKGVNHLVFHTFSHTPQTNVYPGSSFGGNIGFPLVRQQTWWKYMTNWIEYLSRNQYLLQQGEFVADVLSYYGDHLERPPFDLDEFPKGYKFDYLNSEILQEKLTLKQGKIHVENGGNYRIITLRDSQQMLLSTAIKLKELVLDGAIILGDKPLESPSLMDDENDLKQLKLISDELWGTTKKGKKQSGKGSVYWGFQLNEVLEKEKIKKDVIINDALNINWIHRETEDAHLYFIASKEENPVDVSISFRIDNLSPQIWDAFTGNQQEAKIWKNSNNRTNVALSLAKNGSTIIVFHKSDKKPVATKVSLNNKTVLDANTGWYQVHKTNEYSKIFWKGNDILASNSGEYIFYNEANQFKKSISVKEITLQNNWKLSFDTQGWETPNFLDVAELKSLSTFTNEAVQHYSGTVTYSKNFEIKEISKTTILNLGAVENIAEVWLNGKKIGIKWAPPFSFDITKEIKLGKNNLQIKVTNTWRNQLLLDNKRPIDAKKTWTTSPPKKSETKLDKAGLIGPVILKSID